MTSVTAKGQVTIPKELRERFGLSPGTRVRVEARAGQLVVSRVADAHAAGDELDAWIGALDLGEPVDAWIAHARDDE
ncbi:MAG: AbrB/MazE/SpoVT family DNA-binding domain-containing protein [Myxococcota bacterium]